MECYFHTGANYKDLDNIIETFKKNELENTKNNLINELSNAINNKQLKKIRFYIKTYGERNISIEKTELLVKYLLSKLLNKKDDLW